MAVDGGISDDVSGVIESAGTFLVDLFPRIPGGLSLVVWPEPGKRTRWCASAGEAAAAVAELAGSANVYTGVSLQNRPAALREAAEREKEKAGREKRPPKKIDPDYVRGFSETAGAIGAFWAEIDVKGPTHAEENLPPTIDDALAVLHDTFPVPTWHVFSGGGVQAWWMLEDVWVFDKPAERDRAARLISGWVDTLAAKIRKKGWEADTSAKDLARVLRTPYTFNRKPALPQAVFVRAERIDQRYTVDDLEQSIVWPPPRPVATGKPFVAKAAGNGQALSDYDKAMIALSKLATFRRDEYRAWIAVGQALHAVDSSDAMCSIWDAWSLGSPKYQSGACQDKWSTFGERGKMVKLGSLVRWAQDDAGEKDIFTPPAVKQKRADRKEQKRVALEAAAAEVRGSEEDAGGDRHNTTPPGRNDVIENDTPAAPVDPAMEDGVRILDPTDPLDTAKKYVAFRHAHPERPTLLYADSTFYRWNESCYEELKVDALRSAIYRYTAPAKHWVQRGDNLTLEDFKPNTTKVNNVVDALRAACHVQAQAPAWLNVKPGNPPPVELLPAKNGLVHLTPAGPPLLLTPTPAFFGLNALDYEFRWDAPEPVEWLRFLDRLWPDDRESIDALGEVFGYILTPDTSLQKMFLIVGPPRSGKGTIARILSALIGLANVCGPTLSSLAMNFGLWPLVGKLLAVISDARLSGRQDQAIITERLLAISGEDAVTIDRKNLMPLTLKLFVRFLILTNEIPQLADASGALASRFVVFTLEESHLGREDTKLLDRLLPELPGILVWAIQGWRRLHARGHFVQPATGSEAVEEMLNLSSPVKAFVSEWCVVSSGGETPVDWLYKAWSLWSRLQGTQKPAEKHVFGRNLSAAFPSVRRGQKGTGSDRVPVYKGIRLTMAADETVKIARDQEEDRKTRREANCGN